MLIIYTYHKYILYIYIFMREGNPPSALNRKM